MKIKAGILIVFLSLLAISLVAPFIPRVHADFDEWQIELGTDDCFKIPGAISTVSVNSPFWLHSAIVMESGLRWQNITIPKGSTIDSATLRWVCKFTAPKSSQPFATIRGDDEDNSATFSTEANFDNRPRTDASVVYEIPAVTINVPYDTPDLKTIIQEIVDRPGWESGNAIALLLGPNPTGNQVVYAFSFEGDPNKAAILMLTWTPPPPEKPTTLFGAGFNTSSPYVELHWEWNYTDLDFFEVQNSSDGVSWTYLGQSTTANYTDAQVVNGTERYYRVRANNLTGGTWFNSSFSDVDFETVYFIPGTPGPPGADVNVTGEWVEYRASAINASVGVVDGGDLNSTFEIDGDTFNVSEVVGAPGMLLSVNFTGIDPDAECVWVSIWYLYDGNLNHVFEIEVWNFTSSSWITDGLLVDTAVFEWENSTIYGLRIPNEFLSGGEVRVQLNHETPGNINHDLFIDYIRLIAEIPSDVAPAEPFQFFWIVIGIALMIIGIVLSKMWFDGRDP